LKLASITSPNTIKGTHKATEAVQSEKREFKEHWQKDPMNNQNNGEFKEQTLHQEQREK
jgi:hypothetical protein